ncbi:MAG: restriction endonuclease subunit S [Gemmatimonadota bacterium]
MSRIDELMAGRYPAGMELIKLGKVFEMKAGKHISAGNISAIQNGASPYPCYGGNGVRGFVSASSHDGAFLLIGRQGALCGNIKRVTGRFFATEHAVVVKPRVDIDLDWAFHMLTAMNLNQFATKSAQPGLAVGTLELVTIPLPPIAIQREIGIVLNALMTLEAELELTLEAELETRRRQYSYYRDALLAFDEDVSKSATTHTRQAGRQAGARIVPMDELE